MSRFKTINAMKGNLGGKSSSGWLQKIFTSFQFTISICLVMATIVVLSQTSYLKNQETGFDKDQIMVMTLDQEASNKISYIKNELQQYAAVQKIAAANTAIYQGGSAIYFTKIPDTEEDINLSYMAVDENFPELLGLEWIAKKNETAVKSGIIINEMAMEELRLSSEDFSVDLQLGRGNSEVTGVVKDFNYSSSKQPIRPLAMKIISDSLAGQLGAEPSLYLKLSHIENWLEIVKNVEEYYKKAMPDTPFEYYFLDDAFAETLAQERKLGTLLSIFAGLGIVIAGLGLLGLVTFSLERRVKEIGIRKVLGATVSQIIILISRNYLGIMIISATLAIPISWWGLNKWLTNFSNHIDVEIWMALTSTGLILLVGFATVALRTLGASKLNPVDTLRAE